VPGKGLPLAALWRTLVALVVRQVPAARPLSLAALAGPRVALAGRLRSLLVLVRLVIPLVVSLRSLAVLDRGLVPVESVA